MKFESLGRPRSNQPQTTTLK